MKERKYFMKPEFEDRMKKLLPETTDFEKFSEIIYQQPLNFIRCNTLKISPENLKKKLEKKWEVAQPFENFPEIFLVNSDLMPGELGKAEEHLFGYFYVQEISSMLPVLALNPEPEDFVLDLCASPGSKTTQIAAKMKNSGTIIANDKDIGRMIILSANLERCGVSNTIVTRMDGINLCERFEKEKKFFDKILVDAPCSGEGTLRSSPKSFLMWNKSNVERLSKIQKNLIFAAAKILKKGGVLVYSTCTHSPEENEKIVSFLLENFPEFEVEKVNFPIKCRRGIENWEGEKFGDMKNVCRIYPQDNNSEGFFVAKFRRKE